MPQHCRHALNARARNDRSEIARQLHSNGERLGARERDARSLMWDIGDWWNEGEAYGDRVTPAMWRSRALVDRG